MNNKISVVITSYKEPKTIGKAIEGFLKQDVKVEEIIVSAPDEETLDVVKKYSARNKKVKIFQDPGEGKGYALNQLLLELRGNIIVLSDGDVYVNENSLKYLLEPFKDPKV